MKLLLVLITIFASSFAWAKFDFETPCTESLHSAFQNAAQRRAKFEQLKSIFDHLPNKLFDDGGGEHEGLEFYASNEFDWDRAKPDYKPADVVLGFATNNVWDIAVRKNAKAMIIGDWVSGPLMGQQFLLNGFFRLAKTRSEFMSYIVGADLGNFGKNQTASEFFSTLSEKARTAQIPNSDFQQAVIDKIKAHSALGPAYAYVVHGYYETAAMAASPLARFSPMMIPSPFPGRGALIGKLIQFYYTRYNPNFLYQGAPPEGRKEMDETYFSFLSSEAAYQRLRNLFVSGNVYYVHSDFTNQGIYQAAGDMMRQRGFNSIAVYTSNIVDVVTDNNERKAVTVYRDYVRQTTESLLAAGIKPPILFYQTRGTEFPHQFERHEINRPQDSQHLTSAAAKPFARTGS